MGWSCWDWRFGILVDSSRWSLFVCVFSLFKFWWMATLFHDAIHPIFLLDGNKLNGHVPTEVGRLKILEDFDIRKFFPR
jgi:hypothetical protein